MAQMQESDRNRIFDGWIASHKAILFKVARVYGNSPADRDDLFQEIALHVWQSVPVFRGDSAIGTWIYRIALNTAMAWLRNQKKHGQGRRDIGATMDLLIAPSVGDPRLDWIYQRIAELDEASRSLALLMLDGHSYRDMSEILGISESNVGVKINRIKAAFTAQLAKEEHDGL
jgi:RNA polymerase sigma-70 factor, ECF subfamily